LLLTSDAGSYINGVTLPVEGGTRLNSRAHAYGAVGITDSIKELLGGSGALVETGLLLYDGRIVCDGLVSPLAWIGPSYKRDFNEALSKIRAVGQFYTDHLVPRSGQERGSVGW
jgi:hypothetical protein